jgi:large subunit ribosomal protein L25
MAVIKAKVREHTGTGPSRADRRADLIPAVLYGEGVETPVHVVADKRQMDKLLTEHGLGSVVTVKLDNQADYPAMIKDVQYHPVRGHIIHVDFQGISLTKKMRTVVAIVLEGTPEGVKAGGILQHQLRELEVECLPQDLPDNVVAEIDHLDLGETLFVRDLQVSPEVTVLTDEDELVVTVLAPRAEDEEEEEEEAAEETAVEADAPAEEGDEE